MIGGHSDITSWSIHFTVSDNGTLIVKDVATGLHIANNSICKSGVELEVIAVPDEGYEIDSLKLNDISISDKSTFMLMCDVNVAAVFRKTVIPDPDPEPALTAITITYDSNYPAVPDTDPDDSDGIVESVPGITTVNISDIQTFNDGYPLKWQ